MKKAVTTIGLVAALSVTGSMISEGVAQSVGDFYQGKTIHLTLGTGAGGSYDLYGRQLIEFLGRHVPGNPNFVVVHQPGAGGNKAANYVYNVAPKDGTVIGLTQASLPLYQVLDGKGARYDVAQKHWLGSIVNIAIVIGVWHEAPARSLADAMNREVVLGSTGPGSDTYIVPTMLNAIMGTKFKVVTGYDGAAGIIMAIERGEVHGGGVWAALTSSKADWVRGGKILPLVQLGTRKAADLPDVPLALDYAQTPDDKILIELISSGGPFSRAPWLAPGVPQDRVQALRAGFKATMADPDFLASAKKRNLLIDPVSGDELQSLVKRMVAVPPSLLARARDILRSGR